MRGRNLFYLLLTLQGVALPWRPAMGESFDCVMEPAQKVKIGSAVTGILKAVPVERGDAVKQGETIAELDDSVEAENLDLAITQANSTEGIEAQRARMTLAREKLDRMAPLAAKEVVSKDKLQEVQADYEIANRDLNAEIVKQHLAEIEVLRAKATLALRTVKSPLNGLVMDKNLLPGEFVNQEAFILTLVQLDPLYVEAYVPVSYYTSIKTGMKGTIYPAQPIGGRYVAPITVVDHVFDAASGTFQVRLELQNKGNVLPGGERCRVDLALPSVPPVSEKTPAPISEIGPEGGGAASDPSTSQP